MIICKVASYKHLLQHNQGFIKYTMQKVNEIHFQKKLQPNMCIIRRKLGTHLPQTTSIQPSYIEFLGLGLIKHIMKV